MIIIIMQETKSSKRYSCYPGLPKTHESLFSVELYNSQVMLKGLETSGYVIVGAAKASILSRDHQPVWKGRHLKSKTTWVGSLECMQVCVY